jgi:hypothetical protein
VFLASLVYLVPVFLAIMVFFVAIVGIGASGSDDAGLGAVFCGIFFLPLALMVVGLIAAVFAMGIVTHYNAEDRFSAFFQLGEVWRHIRANAGTYFGALGLAVVVNVAVSVVTSPVFSIVSLVTLPMMPADPAMAGPDEIFTYVGAVWLFAMGVSVLVSALYIPAYLIQMHFFGQYMGRAYGMAPSPAQDAPQPDSGEGSILPPPPPPPNL